MSVADELAKLADLRDRGVLSEEEFGRQKALLLGDPTIPDDEDGDVSERSASPETPRSDTASTVGDSQTFTVEGRSPGQRQSDGIVNFFWLLLFLSVSVFFGLACEYGVFGTGGLWTGL